MRQGVVVVTLTIDLAILPKFNAFVEIAEIVRESLKGTAIVRWKLWVSRITTNQFNNRRV